MIEFRDVLQWLTLLLLSVAAIQYLRHPRQIVCISVKPVLMYIAGLITFYIVTCFAELSGISLGSGVMVASALLRLIFAVMVCGYVWGLK